MENETPKFSLVEMIIGAMICLFIDFLAALGDLLSAGVFGFLIQALSWLVFTFWFTIKGARATATLSKRFVIPIIIQIVPIIPTITATFLVTVYFENHPEKLGALQHHDIPSLKK